ncbi:MAG: MFS transporter [Ignavibacteria bacterium]|nr:MFS transporter [Ignavibacteria bacterium]MCU7500062.1 MFS transporter [Ignavibacteria bacterium]MCU7512793.1 MFS transporter [Ignavibacteria bacterium]MCU7521796.1 MFS transporter [Ignavibacteria bacterium]MCU7524845.1 MFS transporter [Ignavibacteria bacterium]
MAQLYPLKSKERKSGFIVLNWFSEYSSDTSVKRNFLINVADGSLYAFAMSFISLTVVMPVFVRAIGGSNVAVGLIPIFWTVGFNFPQILVANYSSRFPLKKVLLLKTALGQRLPWLLLAALSYFVLESANSSTGLIIFFFCFLLAAVAGSINLPGWFDLVAKLTPVKLRGRLFASRVIFGAVLGIVGGWYVKVVLGHWQYPHSFSLLFLSAFLVMMVSYVFLTLIKEDKPDMQEKHMSYGEFFRMLPGILKKEKNFRNFLIADSLLIIALMGEVFYSLNALKKFSLPDSYVGNFTIIIMTFSIVGNIFFGYLGDHFGHKLNMLLGACFTTMACLAALMAPDAASYSLVFIGSAFTAGVYQLSKLPIIAELCAEENRPTYVALSNMISSPFSLAGLFGGYIANRYGYNMVFTLAAIFAGSSALWLFFAVKEPRKNAVQEITEEA